MQIVWETQMAITCQTVLHLFVSTVFQDSFSRTYWTKVRGRISFWFTRIKILCNSCIYYMIQWEKLILISGCYENHCENRFSDSRRISSPASSLVEGNTTIFWGHVLTIFRSDYDWWSRLSLFMNYRGGTMALSV